MPRISHFDIPVDNPERAQKFYNEVFDWKFEKWDGPIEYWMVKTGTEQPGIDGGLSKRMPGQMGITNTINVPSIDEFSKKSLKKEYICLFPKWQSPKLDGLLNAQTQKETCLE